MWVAIHAYKDIGLPFSLESSELLIIPEPLVLPKICHNWNLHKESEA
jgi:hypothetical protein